MRSVRDRDKTVVVSAVLTDGDCDLLLPSAPRPESVQLWINGLRATDFSPEIDGGQHVRVDDLEEGDIVTLTYASVD